MDIALIAMSGIRAVDADLLALGLTLPGFVERSRTIASLPSLGLLTLAGMTPAPHRARYYEAATADDLPRLPERADLVAISALTAQIREAYALADRYRARGVPVVLGGLHVSSLPEEAAQHADAVVVGQGEAVWPEVLRDAEEGFLQPRYRGSTRDFHLRDAPMPDFAQLDTERYNRLTVQTSRGCPHRCEFCASSILISEAYQQKPIARVLAEIDAIKEIWQQPFIEFADDNSFVNRRWWKAFLPQLAKRGVKWFTETDISVADDDALLRLMKEAGCRQVLIGLESPDADDLDGIEERRDWKARQAERYRQAIARIQGHGITVNGCFVLGLDRHGPDIFERVERFVLDSGLYEVQITLQTPFPGTPLYRRLASEGRLLNRDDWDRCTLFDCTFVPRRMSVAELRTGFHDLMRRLYDPEVVACRRQAFFAHWRACNPRRHVDADLLAVVEG